MLTKMLMQLGTCSLAIKQEKQKRKYIRIAKKIDKILNIFFVVNRQ